MVRPAAFRLARVDAGRRESAAVPRGELPALPEFAKKSIATNVILAVAASSGTLFLANRLPGWANDTSAVAKGSSGHPMARDPLTRQQICCIRQQICCGRRTLLTQS